MDNEEGEYVKNIHVFLQLDEVEGVHPVHNVIYGLKV